MGTTEEKLNYLMETKSMIADAITSKGIAASASDTFRSYVVKIQSIETGGGQVVDTPKAVRFFDYDGTLLYTYTAEEFLALTEFPPIPNHSGLLCEGWNQSFSIAQEYVRNYGKMDIGAVFTTDDGKTRLYMNVYDEYCMAVRLNFYQGYANGVAINWGDGSAEETIDGVGDVYITHTYAELGDYVITLDIEDGVQVKLGRNDNYPLVGAGTNYAMRNMLTRVEIGKCVTTISSYAFSNCSSLTSIVIPSSVTTIYRYIFNRCLSLTSIVIPSSVTSIGEYIFNRCYSLTSIVIPSSMTTIGNYAFSSCYSLTSIVIPSSVTTIGTYAFESCSSLTSIVIPPGVTGIFSSAFSSCYSLTSIVIPSGVTTISSYAFSSCSSLTSIVIPSSVTSIYNHAFSSCRSMVLYDFRNHSSVPSLNTNVFTDIPSACKIVVPDALYDEWIAATNWASWASRIVRASEYES